MSDHVRKLKRFDKKASKTVIKNRVTELSEAQKQRIDTQVCHRALCPLICTRKAQPCLARRLFFALLGAVVCLAVLSVLKFYHKI